MANRTGRGTHSSVLRVTRAALLCLFTTSTGAAQALVMLAALLPATVCGDTATWDRFKKEYDDERIILQNQTVITDVVVLENKNCHLTEIGIADFNISLPNLKYIYFTFNNLRHVDPAVFSGFPRVTYLFLDVNNLTAMPVFEGASVLPNLEALALMNNQITAIDNPKTFSSIKRLKLLNLSDNLIEYIHPEVFQGMSKLVNIHLSGNKLKYIPDRQFAIPALYFLSLNDNLIEYVAPGAFRGTRLGYFFIYGNRLTHLPEHFVSNLTSTGVTLEYCHFENNPFQCACLSELLAEMKQIGKCDHTDYGAELYTAKTPMCEPTNDGQQCKRLSEAEYISRRSIERN